MNKWITTTMLAILVVMAIPAFAQSQAAGVAPASPSNAHAGVGEGGESAGAAADAPAPTRHTRTLEAAIRLMTGGVTPKDIARYKQRRRANQRAAAPTTLPAKAVSDVIPVSLQPGAKAPVVTVLHGFVSAIEVLDSTGQPWPILKVRVGSANAFEVVLAPATQPRVGQGGDASSGRGASTGNTIIITPLEPFAVTNVVLMLAGESHPVSFLVQAREATDAAIFHDRVTLIVGGDGPNAHVQPIADYSTLDAGPGLRNILVGQVPTQGAHEVFGHWPGDMRVWREGDRVWLRTVDTLINPAPKRAVSMGAVRAYALPWMPVIVVSRHGQLTPVSIVGDSMPQQLGGAP